MFEPSESPAAAPSTSVNTSGFLKTLQETAAANGGEHMGDVVYWTLTSADVERSVLEKKWTDAGLDPKHLPEPQTPEKALRLAVRSATTNLGDKRQGTLVRPTLDSTSALIYAVVEEGHDKQGNYFSTQRALVMLDKANKLNMTVTTDNPTNETAALILKEYTRYLTTHPSRDVMTSIVKACKSFKGVALRDTGGIYWIPRFNSAKVLALQNAVEGLGSSEVFILPVYKTAQTERALEVAVSGSIETELKELHDEIEVFLSDPDAVRPSTLDRRLKAFEELRARADMYRSILSVTVQDLSGRLSTMEAAVHAMLGEKRT